MKPVQFFLVAIGTVGFALLVVLGFWVAQSIGRRRARRWLQGGVIAQGPGNPPIANGREAAGDESSRRHSRLRTAVALCTIGCLLFCVGYLWYERHRFDDHSRSRDSDAQQFRAAVLAGSVEALDDYARTCSECRFRAAAQQLVGQEHDRRAYRDAAVAWTPDVLEQYARTCKECTFREVAQHQAFMIRDSGAFQSAMMNATAEAIHAYLAGCEQVEPPGSHSCAFADVARQELAERSAAEARLAVLASLEAVHVGSDHPAVRSGVAFEPDGLAWADASGEKGHALIQDAVDAVRDGGLVVVRPGRYDRGFLVEKPIHVIGGGIDASAVVVEVDEGRCVTWKASEGRLERMTLNRTAGKTSTLFIDGGSPNVAGCDLQSTGGLSIVSIRGTTAKPVILRNRIHDGNESGILVHDGATGRIEENEIAGNRMPGIAIASGANPTVRGNAIHGGKGAGIAVYEQGKGVFEDNNVYDNEGAGMAVISGGTPVVRNNRIVGNRGVAVWVNASSGAVFDRNVLFSRVGAWRIAGDSLIERSGNIE